MLDGVKRYLKEFSVLRETGREFWGVQIINFLDSLYGFAFTAVATLFLSNNMGFGDIGAGAALSWLGILTSIFFFAAGPIVDRFGIKKSLYFSLAIVVFVRLGMAACAFGHDIPGRQWLFLALMGLGGLPGSIKATAYQIGIKRFTTERSRSAGFNLWYILMNVGAAGAGLVIHYIEKAQPGREKKEYAWVLIFGLVTAFFSFLSAWLLVNDKSPAQAMAQLRRLPVAAYELITNLLVAAYELVVDFLARLVARLPFIVVLRLVVLHLRVRRTLAALYRRFIAVAVVVGACCRRLWLVLRRLASPVIQVVATDAIFVWELCWCLGYVLYLLARLVVARTLVAACRRLAAVAVIVWKACRCVGSIVYRVISPVIRFLVAVMVGIWELCWCLGYVVYLLARLVARTLVAACRCVGSIVYRVISPVIQVVATDAIFVWELCWCLGYVVYLLARLVARTLVAACRLLAAVAVTVWRFCRRVGGVCARRSFCRAIASASSALVARLAAVLRRRLDPVRELAANLTARLLKRLPFLAVLGAWVKRIWASVRNKAVDGWRRTKNICGHPSFRRMMAAMVLTLGVRMVFLYWSILSPKYWKRVIGPEAAIGPLESINPVIIIIGLFLLVPVIGRFKTFTMMTYGCFTAALALVPMFIPWYWVSSNIVTAYYTTSIVSMIVFSFGEIMFSPRLSQYILDIAPKDQEGIYSSFAALPMFIGHTAVGFLSGVMLMRWCPEKRLLDGAAALLPLRDVLASKSLPYAETPEMMWLILAAAALVGPLLMLPFKKWFIAGLEAKITPAD